MFRPILLLAFAALLATASCKNSALRKTVDPRLADIRLPPGFRISLFADQVDNARSMALGARGTVFVGNRKGDKVYALVDADRDGRAETKYTIADGMNTPNGLAFKDGALYIAEVSKIWRLDNIEKLLAAPPRPVLVYDSLPSDKQHGWKYIAFGRDGKLYIPIGAPCNICDAAVRDPRYASISRMNADGTGFEVFASGIRNSVGFDWHPQSGQLWFTENGRDMMGNDIPPDELNVAPTSGLHFGYPYCHGGDIPDPEFGTVRPCEEFQKPVQKLAPHTAALGMKFLGGPMFPSDYTGSVLIAEHGSWNRDEPIGYRVMRVKLQGEKALSYESFAEGWLKNGKAWGRPVDILQLPDGSVLLSDDFANCVYRITYKR